MVAIARKGVKLRAIVLASAIAAMALGIYGGLLRLGLPLGFGPELAQRHGAIMVCGVFGTLISLERAVAMGRSWPHLAPAMFALGAAGLLAGVPAIIAGLLFVCGASVLTIGSLVIFGQQPALFTFALVCGAVSLIAGNVLWLSGAEIPHLVGWWLAFLVFTIAAERLELSRVLRPPPIARPAFVVAVGLLLVGAALGLTTEGGSRTMGVALLATAAWLTRYDIARTTIRGSGAARFFAAAMLAGYAWLGSAGVLLLMGDQLTFGYDVALHAIFIGFVISMVFAHALIILPAVTGIRLRYHWTLYLPLVLLHLSVALRIGGGVLDLQSLRLLSGPLTTVSLLMFAAVLLFAGRSSRRVGVVRPEGLPMPRH